MYVCVKLIDRSRWLTFYCIIVEEITDNNYDHHDERQIVISSMMFTLIDYIIFLDHLYLIIFVQIEQNKKIHYTFVYNQITKSSRRSKSGAQFTHASITKIFTCFCCCQIRTIIKISISIYNFIILLSFINVIHY